nr:immunoglobulin light chain junction region [Macaca mulatta]
CNSYTVF